MMEIGRLHICPETVMTMSDPSDFSWTEGWGAGEPGGRDRREAERVIRYWERRLGELGGVLTVAALDFDRIENREWANRFLIAVDPVIERSTLLLYGPRLAQLLRLPPKARTDLPLPRQLPRRYAEVFMRGCGRAREETAPVRLDGEVERYDGKIEQYRAVFIPIRVKPDSLTCFAFGAFNCRVVEPKPAD
jgi:hypothetical protein